MAFESSAYYAALRDELGAAMGEVAATCPENLWPSIVRYMLKELEAQADDPEALLKAIRAEIDARLITGEW